MNLINRAIVGIFALACYSAAEAGTTYGIIQEKGPNGVPVVRVPERVSLTMGATNGTNLVNPDQLACAWLMAHVYRRTLKCNLRKVIAYPRGNLGPPILEATDYGLFHTYEYTTPFTKLEPGASPADEMRFIMDVGKKTLDVIVVFRLEHYGMINPSGPLGLPMVRIPMAVEGIPRRVSPFLQACISINKWILESDELRQCKVRRIISSPRGRLSNPEPENDAAWGKFESYEYTIKLPNLNNDQAPIDASGGLTPIDEMRFVLLFGERELDVTVVFEYVEEGC